MRFLRTRQLEMGLDVMPQLAPPPATFNYRNQSNVRAEFVKTYALQQHPLIFHTAVTSPEMSPCFEGIGGEGHSYSIGVLYTCEFGRCGFIRSRIVAWTGWNRRTQQIIPLCCWGCGVKMHGTGCCF